MTIKVGPRGFASLGRSNILEAFCVRTCAVRSFVLANEEERQGEDGHGLTSVRARERERQDVFVHQHLAGWRIHD